MKIFPEVSLLLIVRMSHKEQKVTFDIAGRVCRLITGNTSHLENKIMKMILTV